jgi:hypothetical protein
MEVNEPHVSDSGVLQVRYSVSSQAYELEMDPPAWIRARVDLQLQHDSLERYLSDTCLHQCNSRCKLAR